MKRVLLLVIWVFTTHIFGEEHSLAYKCNKEEDIDACRRVLGSYISALEIELDWFTKEDLKLKKEPIITNLADKVYIFYGELCPPKKKEDMILCIRALQSLYGAGRFVFDPAAIAIANLPMSGSVLKSACKNLLEGYFFISRAYIYSPLCNGITEKHGKSIYKACSKIRDIREASKHLIENNTKEIARCQKVLFNR
ncbi:hypothetical protein [Hydrogenivirga sp. 128-5-R1-1]|uniref:hypothetical protein n=1 Tax=Hydrogenivirga sp. 128-5-R1-1 TaxID=392423 RepID=UPI00015F1926|nr:hypothetical protein [Hydrogenivirga sp. 128-5-R1-1]EDP75384.1 hypothetical protein HG1285_15506 [Hydrogenivirga sp. 128-5-R1-1]